MSLTREQILKKTFVKNGITSSVSINDLREKDFNGEFLSQEQKRALENFDKFRLAELEKISNDMEFHERYRQLQVMANLGDYKEFLKEKYSLL